MYLKKLEISGFKSFAKKTLLEFRSPITAIVGPNGSGKSNVAESFRFVLGEQSMKSMRGKRGEDMIWNGSDESPRAGRASSKVIFDNSNKIFNFDFDEVSIERIVSRDGANEYLLNGSQVRLKDILELLTQAHIGASRHHIISQGEADRVLTASIKERREIIEDALSLKIYQYKKEESERKLIKTDENIKQVELLRKEIAPHLRFLKKQVEKAERAIEVRENLIGFYREYLKRENIYIKHKKHNIKKEKEPLLEKKIELDSLMQQAKEILEKSENKDAKSSELIEIENNIRRAREESDRLRREVGSIEGEINANERTIERIKSHNASIETKTIKLKEVESFLLDIKKDEEDFKNESSLERLRDIVSGIFTKLDQFLQKYREEEDTSGIEDLKNSNENLISRKEELDNKLVNLIREINNFENEYQNIKTSIEKEKDSSREAEKTIFRISSEQSEIRSKINILEVEEKGLVLVEENWKREVEEGGVLLGTSILGFQSDEIRDHTDKVFSDDEIFSEERYLQENRRKELEKLKIRLEELGGAGGADIIKEYKDTEERDLFLARELEDLGKSAESLKEMILELEEKLDVEFKVGVEKINEAFNKFFSTMFDGGEAHLTVVANKKPKSKYDLESEDFVSRGTLDSIDEDKEKPEEGVEISVSLPKKRIKSLEMLSGGERALTSIALIFAISQVNPPPFIILDETDAALDEANSKRYGDMIEALSKYSQLILITHNRETMSRAGVIYGVTMGSGGVSKLLSIAFDQAVAVAK